MTFRVVSKGTAGSRKGAGAEQSKLFPPTAQSTQPAIFSEQAKVANNLKDHAIVTVEQGARVQGSSVDGIVRAVHSD
jgi:hypothetical protein